MTTLTNSVVAKFAVAFVAMAMAFAAFAPVASAQSLDDMSLEDLIALVNQLQSQIGQGGDDMMSGGSCSYVWTRSLTTGSTGADVMDLQMFLNMDPDTVVALSGAGSPGAETSYYGALTAAAVSKFQTKYSAEILVPVGLVNPTGYFGPSTMAKANSLCASMTDGGDDMDDDDSDSDDSDDEEDDTLNGGEADVDDVEASDEDDEAEEDEEDVPVLNVEFDVEDGDVRLERVDVTFDGTAVAGTDAEDEPWDVFEEISLWVDGDKIASADADDEDDWDENTGEEFVFRLTQIDEIFREDTTGEIIVAVSIQGGVDVDGDSGDDDWEVFIDEDGLRFMDGEGLDIEVPSAETDRSIFEIQEAGEGNDLDLESSNEDPDSSTLEIDEDDETEHLVFAFDLSADDSDGDIVLDNLVSVNVSVGGTEGTSLDNFIDDFRLEIDGESFDAESYTGSVTGQTIDFDIDGDVVIDEDETVTAYFYAIFDDGGNSFTDATIQASTSAGQIDAEGDSSGETVTVSGTTRTGDQHTVRTSGLEIGDVTDGDGSTDAVHNDQDTAANSYGEFFLTFDVTAFGDDAYIPTASTSRAAAAALAGVTYTIENSDTNAATSAGAVSITYDVDGADEDNGYFFLEEGETYEMTVSVNSYNPTVANGGTFNFQLISIGFNTEEAGVASTEAATPSNDYESDSVFIEN